MASHQGFGIGEEFLQSRHRLLASPVAESHGHIAQKALALRTLDRRVAKARLKFFLTPILHRHQVHAGQLVASE